MGPGRIVPATDFVKSSADFLNLVVSTGEACYITKDGKASAVLIEINRYNAMMDIVEGGDAPTRDEIGDQTRQVTSVKGYIKKGTKGPRRRDD